MPRESERDREQGVREVQCVHGFLLEFGTLVWYTHRSKKTRLTVPCGQGNTSKTLEIRVYVFSFAPKWYYIVVHVFTVYILRYMWVPLKGPGPVSWIW